MSLIRPIAIALAAAATLVIAPTVATADTEWHQTGTTSVADNWPID
jgi:hypothetical protein